MKKLLVSFVITAVLAMAAAVPLYANDARIAVDGEFVQVVPPPVAVDGYLMFQLFPLAEIIAAEVRWTPGSNPGDITLARGHMVLNISAEGGVMRAENAQTGDSREHQFEVPPMLIDGAWHYPLESVARALGVGMGWNEEMMVLFIGDEPDWTVYRQAAHAAERENLEAQLAAALEEIRMLRFENEQLRRAAAEAAAAVPVEVPVEAAAPTPAGAEAAQTPAPAERGSHEPGNFITFGNLRWLVLEEQEDMLFLLSEYVLFPHEYHSDRADVTWEHSALRRHLNGAFLNSTFTRDERQRIVLTTLANDPNRHFNTPGGNNTDDRIFVLSIDEVNLHLGSEAARIAYHPYGETYGWWLRSPGMQRDTAARVGADGIIYFIGDFVDNITGGVRPALWLRR